MGLIVLPFVANYSISPSYFVKPDQIAFKGGYANICFSKFIIFCLNTGQLFIYNIASPTNYFHCEWQFPFLPYFEHYFQYLVRHLPTHILCPYYIGVVDYILMHLKFHPHQK